MASRVYKCPDCSGNIELSELTPMDRVIECEHCAQKITHMDLILLEDMLDGAPRFELQIGFAIVCAVGLLIALFAVAPK